MDSSTTMLLHETLECMYNTKDVDELTNIFSSLGIYLLSKDTPKEIIIRSEQLYERIFLLLNDRSHKNKVIALNFISALFISIHNDGPSCVFIQNMIRITGCLKEMSDLFASIVMQKNISCVLCSSLSEVCCGSNPNQCFCSHLVPICIKKCQQHREMFLVLHSLLYKHTRNTRLFHLCHGMTIFTRDSLEYEDCLKLLNIVVENTEGEERMFIQKASYLFDHLQYLSRANDSSSMISKWASSILYSYCKYYMNDQNESAVEMELDNKTNKNSKEEDTNPTIVNDAQKELFSNKTNVLFKNILNEIIISNKHEIMSIDQQRQFKAIQKRNYEKFLNERVTNINQSLGHDFMTESVRCKRNERSFSNHSSLDRFVTNNSIRKSPFEGRNDRSSVNYRNISFTKKTTYNSQLNKSKINIKSTCTGDSVDDSLFLYHRKRQNENGKPYNPSIDNESVKDEAAEFVIDFSPRRSSTPLDSFVNIYESFNASRSFISQNCTQLSSIHENNCVSMQSSVSRTALRSFTDKKFRDSVRSKIYKNKRNETLTKLSRSKTVTSRILDVVNMSCTTIAKSFNSLKNIFNTYNEEESIETPASEHSNNTCNYSFSNCLREREKEQEKSQTKDDNSEPSSCNTCDNTIAAKQKFANDYYLQRTVNLLKRGINLYGCDFKRISKTMWPHDKSMTPKVLYKLYRKLIMK